MVWGCMIGMSLSLVYYNYILKVVARWFGSFGMAPGMIGASLSLVYYHSVLGDREERREMSFVCCTTTSVVR